MLGALLFAAGSLWYITHDRPRARTTSPDFLPGMLIGGAGVGLVIPTLTGAGASSLAPERFATGAAVLTMGRQIGAALGVAVLVAVLGTAASTVADFHAAWLITVVRRPRRAPSRSRRSDRPRPRVAAPGSPRARHWRGERGMSALERAAQLAASAGRTRGGRRRGARAGGPRATSAGSPTARSPAPPIAELLGFEIVEAEPGRAVFALEPAEWMYNPIGSVHGGVAATLLDSCMGCAVHTTLEAGIGYTTSDLQVRYIRAMSAGDWHACWPRAGSCTSAAARRPPRGGCSSRPTTSCSPTRRTGCVILR